MCTRLTGAVKFKYIEYACTGKTYRSQQFPNLGINTQQGVGHMLHHGHKGPQRWPAFPCLSSGSEDKVKARWDRHPCHLRNKGSKTKGAVIVKATHFLPPNLICNQP